MGCGCGKKAARPAARTVTSVKTPAPNANKTTVAKTYQSGTMRQAPTGPVTNSRRTV